MDPNFQFSASSSTAAKIERRIIEKNRRNQMKNLCDQLKSLVPQQDSKEVSVALPDQIDEAIKYIKELEEKVNSAKEKKNRLQGKNKSSINMDSASSSSPSSSSPQLKINQMGKSLEIVLSSGLDNQYLLCETLGILEEEGIEVVNASFSVCGNSVFHTIHAQLEVWMVEFGVTKARERLKRLVYGWNSDMEMQKEKQWWDEFPCENWDY